MSEPEPEPEMTAYVVTCETSGCGNAGISIPIQTVKPESGDPNVVCGVCGQPITNIVDDTREAAPNE